MRRFRLACLILVSLASVATAADGPPAVDVSGFRGAGSDQAGGIRVERDGPRLILRWGDRAGSACRVVLDLRPQSPLFESLGIVSGAPGGPTFDVLKGVDPTVFVTVGTRQNPPGRPPGMSLFNSFFDGPASRPHRTYRGAFARGAVRVRGDHHRATVALGGLTAGPFSGEWRVTVYRGSPLVHLEAALTTREDARAFTYDLGLSAGSPTWKSMAWRDTEGVLKQEDVDPKAGDRPLAVRHRAAAITNGQGSLAIVPPPHQFFYPRDLTDNQKTIWSGTGHRGLDDRFGFGIRQTETGSNAFIPWFNAPPGSEQRMGAFLLIGRESPEAALDEALSYTRNDRFADLSGHVTMASHWHMAIAVAAMKEIAAGTPRTTPDFVRMFKDMNVRIVHLAEFHGDGHPQDPGPLRLPEMKAMFDECRRLSDDRLVFLPGEEANVHLGVKKPGQHPGHWLYLFPKPVYWTMIRAPGQPFAEEHPEYGTVYHVGDAADMSRLIEEQKGLAWTAHPRIKASNWAPDAYKDAPYFRSPSWLGGAWKAMPADLARPKLGERVLDLLDDMANWGARKYVLGEVDVFKLDHTHELFGHMNINYLRLDRAPRYEGDWTPVLDALRQGRFFVTTGEMLLDEFQVGGKASGETLALPPDGKTELSLGLQWTFPPSFVEVISGDGTRVYRERIDLSDQPAFGKLRKTIQPDLTGRTWVRVEAWDVAANGVFSQPVWLEPAKRSGDD